MFYAIRKRIEDPDKPLLGPNIWCLKIFGLILPDNSVLRFFWIIYHLAGTIFVVSQFVELYFIQSDLDQILTNLEISMLSTVCVMKCYSFVLYQETWRDVIKYINEADMFERKSADQTRKTILEEFTSYSRKMTYNYWILLTVTTLVSIFTPVIQSVTRVLSSHRENSQNETVLFPHIFSSYMPFDKYHWPGSWITVIWHLMACYYGSGTIGAFDAIVMVIMVYFGGKLDLLRERCKLMLGSDGAPINDEEAAARIKELHHIHVNILKYSRVFNSLLSPIMFLYMVVCSLMLCANAYRFTSASTLIQKVLLGEYLIFFVAQLFIFCWHSNDVLTKYDKVTLGPYESQWWAANVKQRKNLILLSGQFSITKIFTAGPFTYLTLSTFIAILKGAYSYYTLLRK